MFSRKVGCVFAAMLAAGSLVVMPGCDWLKGSDTGSRQSPFLSNLSVQPSSVLCDQEFTVTFRYDDPQADIAAVRVTLKRDIDAAGREESPLWPDNISRGSGTVSFPFSFTCGTKGGAWKIAVQVEDDRNNESNILSGEVRLNAAG